MEKAIKLDLKIKLLNEEIGQFVSVKQPLKHHMLIAYLASLSNLLQFKTDPFSLEV